MLQSAEVSVQEVAKRFGISRSTLYRNGLDLSWYVNPPGYASTPNKVRKMRQIDLQI